MVCIHFKEKMKFLIQENFLKYFANNYIDTKQYWSNAFKAPGIDATNNTLEGTNSWIKRELTQRH